MATPDHPVLDALARRASSRDFTDAPVPPALLDHVLDAAVRAPTAFNFQPYSLVVVRDPARRAALARIAGGQRHVAAAPVCVVFCADTRRIERLCGLPGQLVPEEHPDAMTTAVIDTSLAGMCATLATQALGLRAALPPPGTWTSRAEPRCWCCGTATGTGSPNCVGPQERRHGRM
ncbi:nitroreductase family protein [Streptomyces sp. NPDC005538]|uniref:nitroreductase family protein n=1 Tax=unclassified Streptomyces TaxID=2593676 RepID=UPI00339F4334